MCYKGVIRVLQRTLAASSALSNTACMSFFMSPGFNCKRLGVDGGYRGLGVYEGKG